jgi:DNA-binding LacI/PurR family transcriptional regulator
MITEIARAGAGGDPHARYDGGADSNMPERIDHVAPDNIQAGHLAASHLIAPGHRAIAFVIPAGRTVSRASKIAGFPARAGAKVRLRHD